MSVKRCKFCKHKIEYNGVDACEIAEGHLDMVPGKCASGFIWRVFDNTLACKHFIETDKQIDRNLFEMEEKENENEC